MGQSAAQRSLSSFSKPFTEENLRQNPNWMWHEIVSEGPAARRHQKCPPTPDGLVWSGVRSARPSVLSARLFLSLS